MKIGIDIDEVLTESLSEIQKFLDKKDGFDLIKNNLEEVMRGNLNKKYIRDFLKNYGYKIFKNIELKQDAKMVINELYKEHEIIFITARCDKYFDKAEELTLELLKDNNILYDEIIFDATNKAKICKNNNIDIMIDDSIKTCNLVSEVNIPVILFSTKLNRNKKTNLKRAENFIELKKIIEENLKRTAK